MRGTDLTHARQIQSRRVRGYMLESLGAATIVNDELVPGTGVLRVYKMQHDAVAGTKEFSDTGARLTVSNLSEHMVIVDDVLVFAEWDDGDQEWYVYAADCEVSGLTFVD